MSEKVEIDLLELTKDYKNTSNDFVFMKNAIKSAVIDAKLDYGKDVEIVFKYRISDFVPLDLWVNGTADLLMENWDKAD